MTYKQLLKPVGNDKEYWNTYKSLSIKEQNLIDTKLFHEIHKIWNYINSKNYDGSKKNKVNSIEEYNQNIEKVSDIILEISIDYNITLKNTMPDKFKKALKNTLGNDWLNYMLKGE